MKKNTKDIVGLSTAAIAKIFNNISTLVGIKIHPHMLRHTFATHLLDAGVNPAIIQSMLGHENINTTTIYAKVNKEEVINVHRKYIY